MSKARKIDHDVEAVYVASILHDTGLSEAHMSEGYRFEVDGANLARAILKKHGVTGQRADVVWDADRLARLVARALERPRGPPREQRRERGLRRVPRRARPRGREVGASPPAPRTNFIPAFLKLRSQPSPRKNRTQRAPASSPTSRYRMVPGFHLSNFVDDGDAAKTRSQRSDSRATRRARENGPAACRVSKSRRLHRARAAVSAHAHSAAYSRRRSMPVQYRRPRLGRASRREVNRTRW